MANVSKIRNIAVRLLLAGASWGFVAWQVASRDNLAASLGLLQQRFANQHFLFLLLAVVLMMVINWLVEALKWRRLMRTVQDVALSNAVVAVLTGVSVSVFTPNRVGEFLGRVFSIRLSSPLRAVLVTLVGSMSQLSITLVAGSVATLFFASQHSLLARQLPPSLQSTVVVLTVAANLAIVMLFLNVSFLTRLLLSLIPRRWRRIRSYVKVFSRFRRGLLLQILSMSLIRYIVFTLQYLLLLLMFGVEYPWPHLLMLIGVIWFVMAAIPSFALAELGIRSSVAVAVFSVYATSGQPSETTAMTLAVVAASSLLWIINIALPALVGTVFLHRLKIPESIFSFRRS
jgi:hypothetical protein